MGEEREESRTAPRRGFRDPVVDGSCLGRTEEELVWRWHWDSKVLFGTCDIQSVVGFLLAAVIYTVGCVCLKFKRERGQETETGDSWRREEL